MIVSELIKKLENYQGKLEVTREFLDKIIKKKVKRSSGNKYKKTVKKEKILLKQLEILIYSNFNLNNIELSKKLNFCFCCICCT